jgi:hypothetical protein
VALAARTPAVGSENTVEFLRGGNFMFNGGTALVANGSGSATGYVSDFGFDNADPTAAYSGGQAAALELAKALKTISIGWGKRNVTAMERYCMIPLDLFYGLPRTGDGVPDPDREGSRGSVRQHGYRRFRACRLRR